MTIERELSTPAGAKIRLELTQDELRKLFGESENAVVYREIELAFKRVEAEHKDGLSPLTEYEIAEIMSRVLTHRQALYDETEIPIVRAEVRNVVAMRQSGAQSSNGCKWCTIKGYPRIEFSPIDADDERLTDGYEVQTELARFCPYCGRKLPEEYTV